MQCSKCGFIMSELDPECLRCKRQGDRNGTAAGAVLAASVPDTSPPALGAVIEEKECPRCGKATLLSAAACDKCGYEYQAEGSRTERYQARLAQEAPLAPPSTLRRTVPPAVSWGIIAACLLVIGGAGWGLFGSSADSSSDSTLDTPIIMAHHRRPRPLVGIQNVTYSVTGTAPQALVTYTDANAAPVSPPSAVELPWTLTLKVKAGTRLSLSAAPAGGTGTIGTSIKVNGTLRKQYYTPSTDGRVTVEDTL